MSKQKSATTAKHFDDLPGSARVGSDVARVIFDVKALSTLWRWEKRGVCLLLRRLLGHGSSHGVPGSCALS